MNEFQNLKGQKILVTGHTGFKGAWLCKFLETIGSETFGYSLEPHPESLYSQMRPLDNAHQFIGDINDFSDFDNFLKKVNPSIVIHMAAQSLVIPSYTNPRETFQTNVLGTVNVIESALSAQNLSGVIAITTDKVYENNEIGVPFKESDPKGGHDPYSGSKAAMEMALNSWQHFYNQRKIKLVAARAGNVIGTGDRSENRLLPDLIESLKLKRDITLRNPNSVRPWQHVLEPLSGYLRIAERILAGKTLSQAYNFGPSEDSHKSVLEVAEIAAAFWGDSSVIRTDDSQKEDRLPEASVLMLDSNLAKTELGWLSKMTAEEAVHLTLSGEKLLSEGTADKIVEAQIRDFMGKI